MLKAWEVYKGSHSLGDGSHSDLLPLPLFLRPHSGWQTPHKAGLNPMSQPGRMSVEGKPLFTFRSSVGYCCCSSVTFCKMGLVLSFFFFFPF